MPVLRSSPTRLTTLVRHSLCTLTFGLLAFAGAAQADWSLQEDQSQVHFVSVKASSVAEINTFEQLSGTLNDQGQAELSIDLNSVDTNIEIRDQRLRELLFRTGEFPAASLTTQVDMKTIDALAVGDALRQPLELNLSLHGQTGNVTADVIITRLASDQLQVTTARPLVINAADFDLVKGINKLQEIAGLPSISAAVPVTATLLFSKD